MVRTTYNNAQTLSYWWLDNYFDFTAEQATQVKADLREFHQWHRSTQLSDYADFLASLKTKSLDDVTPASARADVDRARAAFETLVYRAVPYYARLARQLSPAQIAHLKKRYAVENKKWREKWITRKPEEVAEERLDSWMDWAEHFYGDISREQKAFMKTAIANSIWDIQLSWNDRQGRQEDTIVTLEKIRNDGLDQQATENAIKALMDRSLHSKDAAYAVMLPKLIDEACANLSGLHQLADRAQRINAQEKLASHERELRALQR